MVKRLELIANSHEPSKKQDERGDQSKNKSSIIPLIKSPSDTTIYAPALQLAGDEGNVGVVRQLINNQRTAASRICDSSLAMGDNGQGIDRDDKGPSEFADRVSQFLEHVRLDHRQYGQGQGERSNNRATQDEPQPSTSGWQPQSQTQQRQRDEAERNARHFTVQAERGSDHRYTTRWVSSKF